MNINIQAPISELGYGVVGTNITLALAEKIPVSLFPIGQARVNSNHREVLQKCLQNSTEFDRNAPSLKIWHEHDLATHIGHPVCALTIFETDRFTRHELHQLQSLDHLFVCSEWAKKVCIKNGVREKDVLPDGTVITIGPEIHVCPLGVDRSIFHENYEQSPVSSTVFLNIGKWEYRKGHDLLLEAFNEAFSPTDNVQLLMCCTNPLTHITGPNYNKEWEDSYKDSPRGEKIQLVGRQETQQDIARLMSSVDCGVFPARAEGWNLELLEMMSCGKHVITTFYSGHTEFCNEHNAHFIETDGLEECFDGVFFRGQKKGEWLRLEDRARESLVEQMRNIHHLKQSGQLTQNVAGIETAKKFSWENSASVIERVLC